MDFAIIRAMEYFPFSKWMKNCWFSYTQQKQEHIHSFTRTHTHEWKKYVSVSLLCLMLLYAHYIEIEGRNKHCNFYIDQLCCFVFSANPIECAASIFLRIRLPVNLRFMKSFLIIYSKINYHQSCSVILIIIVIFFVSFLNAFSLRFKSFIKNRNARK